MRERIVFIHACQFKKILWRIWLLENMPIVISGNETSFQGFENYFITKKDDFYFSNRLLISSVVSCCTLSVIPLFLPRTMK